MNHCYELLVSTTTRALAATALCMLSACAAELESPIPTTTYAGSEAPARTLVVLLPGAGDRLGAYDEHGFVAAMRDAGLHVDLLEVDAHYGYYKARTLLDRMEQDVLAPNRGKYEEIWLVGISMGGLGALLTAWTYPEDIDGLILLAPYLGRRQTIKKIDNAGGLAQWQPPASASDADWDVEIWRMLKRISESGGGPDLYLAYGEDDFGVRAHAVLANALPPSNVRTTAGGHAWTTWSTLWKELLADPAVRADLEQ